LIAPVACEPDSALLPLQPPDAVHEVVLLDDQLNVVEPPGATPAGLALNVADGAVEEVTLTVTFAKAPPPEPLQFKVNVVADVIAPVDAEPLTDLEPDQPPDAVQLVAFVALHRNVVDAPDETLFASAVRFTVGGL